MQFETCFLGICFHALDGSGQKFFGFAEYLAGLALMVLAWTIADVRYRFRVRSAPFPLQGITFFVVTAVGVLTLLTDLWRAQQWPVPSGNLLTPGSWQALLGALFLSTFLAWTWFAFIRPPTYGHLNAERYALTLYRFVLKGSPAELAVIADEIAYSARSLVRHATDRRQMAMRDVEEGEKGLRKVEGYANDLLLLIADRRLCRAIVESSPGTALAFFSAMTDLKKYGIPISTFATNIVNEALRNKDSFLYHEVEGYQSGLIGYHKPLSQALFSNYELVDTVGTLLDPIIDLKSDWDAEHWKAYCRVTLLVFNNYIKQHIERHSFVLYRAKGHIEDAASDLYMLNGSEGAWKTDSFQRLRVVVQFIRDAVDSLDKQDVAQHFRVRIRKARGHPGDSIYDHMASMIFEVIFHASAVRSPWWECWSIQHNAVWSEIFGFDSGGAAAKKLIKFKLRRLLFDELVYMSRFPNFKGARILGFCLNVMGFVPSAGEDGRDWRALHRVVLAWTQKHYAWLYEYNPRIAEACLVEGFTFDVESRRLVHTSQANGLRREPSYRYFDLEPAPAPGPGAAAAAAAAEKQVDASDDATQGASRG